jgi:hypothetical protein
MRNPLHFALVVGISSYPWGYYRPLEGPVNDAREFAKWITSLSGGGVPRENVACCITPPGEITKENPQPTKGIIDRSLWLLRDKARKVYDGLPEHERAQTKKTSRLYIYMAGHGIMPGGGKAALLDAEAGDGRHPNLELSEYAGWFERDGTFAEVCIFGDCCRNYEPLTKASGPDFDESPQLGVRVLSLIGYATTAGDLAFEESKRYDPEVPEDERRGYFSRALIDGLKGNAIDAKTGFVTDLSLRNYVRRQVRERTKNRPAHQMQTIEMNPNAEPPITFGEKREVPHYLVVIRFPPELSGEVDLIAPDESSNGRWRISDGPWTNRLYYGLWRVQRAGVDRDTIGAFEVIGADRDVQL